MLDIGTLLVFVPAALALILAPGPDTIYVLTRSVEEGRRDGVAAAAGISTGVLVHTGAAVLGLSILLRESALAFRLVKYFGAIYLVYVGIETLRSPDRFEFDDASDGPSDDGRTGFVRGVFVNVLNPKVALFFLAFLPPFVDSAGPVTPQLLVLGGTYAALTLGYLSGVAFFAGSVRRALATRSSAERVLRGATGSVLVVLGVELAFARRLSA